MFARAAFEAKKLKELKVNFKSKKKGAVALDD